MQVRSWPTRLAFLFVSENTHNMTKTDRNVKVSVGYIFLFSILLRHLHTMNLESS